MDGYRPSPVSKTLGFSTGTLSDKQACAVLPSLAKGSGEFCRLDEAESWRWQVEGR